MIEKDDLNKIINTPRVTFGNSGRNLTFGNVTSMYVMLPVHIVKH